MKIAIYSFKYGKFERPFKKYIQNSQERYLSLYEKSLQFLSFFFICFWRRGESGEQRVSLKKYDTNPPYDQELLHQ